MKRYIISVLGIVVGLGFSAFTKPSSPPFSYTTFKYFGSKFSATQVEDLQKWSASASQLCNDNSSEDYACMISVHDAYTHSVSGVEVLNTFDNHPAGESYIVIVAVDGASGFFKKVRNDIPLPYIVTNGNTTP
jgi:hypothetical protein